MRLKIFTLISLMSLVGCASVNSYVEPKSGSEPLATVSGSSTREGVFDWSSFMVNSIDNKHVGMVWSEKSKINVKPGQHLFVIGSQFNRGLGDGPYSSLTEVYATLKPGMDYKFIGQPRGAHMRVWATASGQKVSKVGSSLYQLTPQPTIVPVIINN
ncbi:MAG: hypothetical protein SFW66_01780 [Gammaproteobacteria bacterium]|nr:hypothetical protein [Gammaproteobacteria bacterium]